MNGYAVMHNSSLTAQSESGSAVAQRAACAAAVEERGVSRKEGKSAVELALASSVSRDKYHYCTFSLHPVSCTLTKRARSVFSEPLTQRLKLASF